ncbi:MAG: MMPL family transporter, partial [Alphaproteobacteria bacterium]
NGGILFLAMREGPSPDRLGASLRSTVNVLNERLRRESPGATLHVTGNFILDVDLIKNSEKDVRRGEMRALPLTFLLLILVFGAVVAASCPILLAVLSIILALGAASLLSGSWQPSVLLQNIVSLLGIALGIDYALLIVSRFRELRAMGFASELAAEQTLRRAGKTVLMSGGSVGVGFLALMIVPIDELRSVALGGLLVALMAAFLATTLLPAWLIWLSDRLDLGRVPFVYQWRIDGEAWGRWGFWVTRRPWTMFVVAAALMAGFAYPAFGLRIAFPGESWLPRELSSVQGLQALKKLDRIGPLYRHLVILKLPDGMSALGAKGWAVLNRLQRLLVADDRVATVYSLPGLAGPNVPHSAVAAFLPESVKHRFVDKSGTVALFEVIPRGKLGSATLMMMVDDIRNINVREITGSPGGRIMVGGIPAATLDYQTVIQRWFPFVIVLVLGGTFVMLLVGFRSVVIPIKAVLLNLLPVGAAFGALSIVFLNGIGLELFGLSDPVEGIFPALPIIVFCTAFGISMDYEVFLVSRIAECRRRMSNSDAIAMGLARTGGIITNAAAIMVAVFGAFAFGAFLPVQMLGFALAVAVLLDATVVRMVLGPALIKIAGRWNWWPGHRG